MIRRRNHESRGTAIPETAITVGVCLMMLFAAFEIATVGYYQVMVDGAAFLAAHESAFGVSNVASVVGSVFSQVAPSNITTSATAVDNTQIPIDYNLSDPTHRHGGVALVRPQHQQSEATIPNVGGILTFDGQPTKPISVSGAFIEPNNITVDPGFNIAGDNPNTVTAADRSAYFNDAINTPPFMIGYHMFLHCGTAYFDLNCPQYSFISLGLGEFLDSDNWNNSANGVNTGGVFEAMACHQRVYAAIAMNDFPATYPGILPPNPPPAKYDETDPSSDFHQVYSWDITVNGGYSAGNTNVGAYPLHPMNGC